MRNASTTSTLVTGLILLGFAGLSAHLVSGGTVVGPPQVGYAVVLIASGILGVLLALRHQSRS